MKLSDLKFRLWNSGTKCFIKNAWIGYPYQSIQAGNFHIGAMGEVETWSENYDDEISVELCFGRDKNDNDIYEGDIVKVTDRDTGGGAKYEVYMDNKKGVSLKGSSFTLFATMCIRNVEVIGNIHENPELLESLENKQ